jgi:hypothetical protein
MKKTFALLLALLLVFSLAACTSGSNEPASSPEPAADPEPAPVIKEAEDGGVFDGRIGEIIRTYFYDFKVTDAYLCDDYHGFTPQDGNALLVVKLDIENTMNSSIPMSDLDFQAQWGDEADDAFAWPITSDPETMEDRGTLCDEQLPYEYEMSVGEKISGGELVYEVPEGYKDFSISAIDDFADDSEEGGTYFVYFTAGYM